MTNPSPYQRSLFEEAVILNISEGRKRRDQGMQRAVDHADRISKNWSERAYQFLLEYLEVHEGPFMAEDVRSYAAENDFDLPPHNRAWGGIFMRARIAGKIKSSTTGKVSNKKAHCANAAVWRKVK